MPEPTKPATPPAQGETLKETLISVVIAFTMAFVFRGFVIEAFVIPTGSMAPTLMGAHMHFHGSQTGHDWPVSALQSRREDPTDYINPQVDISITDPLSGEFRKFNKVPLHTGDRILVLKYLYSILDPSRYDVVVFKNPTNPAQNYIKRLIGLPGEQIALVDGDVFVRTLKPGEIPAPASDAWSVEGWKIARKPDVQQRAVWQLVHDSSLAPLTGSQSPEGPWTPAKPAGWTMKPREYRFDGSVPTTELVYDQTKLRGPDPKAPASRRLAWAIDDYYPYNEITTPDNQTLQPVNRFPVGDLRSRMSINADKAGLDASMTLRVMGQQFGVSFKDTTITLTRRAPAGGPGILGPETTIATGTFKGFAPGQVVNVEVWHVDQSLSVYIDGSRVAHAEYDVSPAQRIQLATGKSVADILTLQGADTRNPLWDPKLFQAGAVSDLRWSFSGSAITLTRVGTDRDLFYQPGSYWGNSGPSLATHPGTVLTLGPDQFFVCGDNSPQSLDGRLWDRVDPWVSKEFPANPSETAKPGITYRDVGIIPREMMLGRAFFVYWPSLRIESSPVPVPDFGRMRFIW